MLDLKIRLIIEIFLVQQTTFYYNDELRNLIRHCLIAKHLTSCKDPECQFCTK